MSLQFRACLQIQLRTSDPQKHEWRHFQTHIYYLINIPHLQCKSDAQSWQLQFTKKCPHSELWKWHGRCAVQHFPDKPVRPFLTKEPCHHVRDGGPVRRLLLETHLHSIPVWLTIWVWCKSKLWRNSAFTVKLRIYSLKALPVLDFESAYHNFIPLLDAINLSI